MATLFSIIVPTYNRASLLPRALDSILKQTYPDWEAIVVDDGSKDNTKEVVAKYQDPRIKYVYQENAERCAARNNGISHATGQYICFLDSDDYYLSNRLELLQKELAKRNFPVEMFYTGLQLDKDGVIIGRSEAHLEEQNIFDRIALSVIHSQQACIHRDILGEFKYDPQFHIGEDMELWLRIAARYPVNYLDDQFTIVAVEHEDRTVNIKRNNTAVHQLRLLRFAFSAPHPGANVSPQVKKALLGNCYFAMAKYYIYNGLRPRAITNLVKSISTDLSSQQLKFRVNVLLKLLTLAPFGKVQDLINY